MSFAFSSATRPALSRRRFVTGCDALGAMQWLGLASASVCAEMARAAPLHHAGTSPDRLAIAYQDVNFTGRAARATAVNASVPGPTLYWRQGQMVQVTVDNHLDMDTSIHWHGILLPFQMDGVPRISFGGIAPGESFTYRFRLRQAGTYWYHSHSGFQEQAGLYGAIVVEPAADATVPVDRDYVVLLSDWTDETPQTIYRRLKQSSDFYNTQQPTVKQWLADVRQFGGSAAWETRRMWNRMRMSPTDISDVSGATYTYLVNGHPPDGNWTGLARAGERIRLRFINGSSETFFDVRIPGLKMTVIAADGQSVEPLEVDEFRIAVAETYDVIVSLPEERAYTIFAQSMDRSGYARATLAPQAGMQAPVPALDPKSWLTMDDMGMAGMSHENMAYESTSHTVSSTDYAPPPEASSTRHDRQHGAALSAALQDAHRLAEESHAAVGSAHAMRRAFGHEVPQVMPQGASSRRRWQEAADREHGSALHESHAAPAGPDSTRSRAAPVPGIDRVNVHRHGTDASHPPMAMPTQSRAERPPRASARRDGNSPSAPGDGMAGGDAASPPSMHGAMSHGDAAGDAADAAAEPHAMERGPILSGTGHAASMNGEMSSASLPRSPAVDMRVAAPSTRLDDPGPRLRSNGRRVLTYADLHTLGGPLDPRPPSREIRLRLTGNMGRFIWGFDGEKFSEAEPLRFHAGEKLRIVLINDTMMNHPIHLHGMFSELEDERGAFLVRKHTVSVQPAKQVAFQVSVPEASQWAFHCHLLYHMEAGMMRLVEVI